MTVEFVYDNDENAGYYGRLISPRDKKKIKKATATFAIEKVSHYLYSEFISHNFDFVSQNSVKKMSKSQDVYSAFFLFPRSYELASHNFDFFWRQKSDFFFSQFYFFYSAMESKRKKENTIICIILFHLQ